MTHEDSPQKRTASFIRELAQETGLNTAGFTFRLVPPPHENSVQTKPGFAKYDLSLDGKRKQTTYGADVEAHEAAHIVLLQNNEAYRTIVEKATKSFESLTKTPMMLSDKERIKGFAQNTLYIRTYEEMVAMYVGLRYGWNKEKAYIHTRNWPGADLKITYHALQNTLDKYMRFLTQTPTQFKYLRSIEERGNVFINEWLDLGHDLGSHAGVVLYEDQIDLRRLFLLDPIRVYEAVQHIVTTDPNEVQYTEYPKILHDLLMGSGEIPPTVPLQYEPVSLEKLMQETPPDNT